MSLHKFSVLAFLTVATVFFSCEDDDVFVPVVEELITTLTVELTPQGGGDVVSLVFSDPDGDGAIAPTITGGTLAANTTYDAAITLLNESETPAEDITEEIEEEQEEHQFFFSITGGLDLVVSYADQDADGNPLGLATTYACGASSSGDLTVILRHEPSKDAVGVKDGDITNAGGETDIEVVFPITIQ
ncbi:hypothetical protein [Lewinella cohaerens]|uniref:hypothetical protein n=1 Tax=Lewinella cohaerens TaxID=70995 RepID=UPI00036E58DA|nr:hypothetical protein [Lewinella cohaerens]